VLRWRPSQRLRIDEQGEPLPDILATCFPFSEDVLIDGRELRSFLADHTINFIGEHSCVLCRRQDLGDEPMSLNGKIIHWMGNLALYAKALQRGNLSFLSSPGPDPLPRLHRPVQSGWARPSGHRRAGPAAYQLGQSPV
jgi:hypothetical protein